MTPPRQHHESSRYVLGTIALTLAAYIVAAAAGLPQQAAKIFAPAASQGGQLNVHGAAKIGPAPQQSAAENPHAQHPPHWTLLPFGLLLLAIAVLPLLKATEAWWESNVHRFYVAAVLAALTLAYYLFWRGFPLEGQWPAPHLVLPAVRGPNFALAGDVLLRAVFGEYGPFILLLFSLYTISGGIAIAGELPARPRTNAMFLAVGAVLANLIGTTGAAMLLIRPLLEVNRQRRHVAHTMVFFIFIVCNCGGCLLPIGDPPLFLGYLLGVDFFWTLTLWREWAFVNLSLIAVYYLLDRFWHYRRESAAAIQRDRTRVHRLHFRGLWPNAPLLLATVVCVALLDPGEALPGTAWHPWLYLREMVLLGLVGLSLGLGRHETRRANGFSYGAIIEVAVLFFGIFICMQPALEILRLEGRDLGLIRPAHFFWSTGGLSSVLDNAPTYVVFFETAKSLGGGPAACGGVAEPLLAAISLGAVFMGAMTYIGNGPNFMARALAERAGVRMPGFFGYMVYSCVILLPLLVLVEWLFLG